LKRDIRIRQNQTAHPVFRRQMAALVPSAGVKTEPDSPSQVFSFWPEAAINSHQKLPQDGSAMFTKAVM
jgi:hypothetical protein